MDVGARLRRATGWKDATLATSATLVNSLGIALLNKIYQGEAMKMTDAENHRTDTEHSDALVAKLFCCQFINSYASLYVLIFLQTKLDGRGELGRAEE